MLEAKQVRVYFMTNKLVCNQKVICSRSQTQSKADFFNLQSAFQLSPLFRVEETSTHASNSAHSHTHSCAPLQQHTVAMSPPLACSPFSNCYWKCWERTHGGFIWHRCTLCKALVEACTIRFISREAREWSQRKTGSNVSLLMSTPLRSHNTLKHTFSLCCLELNLNQAKSITRPPLLTTVGITSSESFYWLDWLKMTKLALILLLFFFSSVPDVKIVHFLLVWCQAFPLFCIPVFQ